MTRREIIKDLLVNLVLFLVLLALPVAVQLIFNLRLPWIYLTAGIPFFLLYLARKKVFVLPTFFVIHGLFLLLPLIFLRSLNEIVPMALAAIAAAVYSVRARTRGEWRPEIRESIQLTACLAALFLIVTRIFGVTVEGVDRFFFAVTLITIAAVLLAMQMENIDKRLSFFSDRLKHTQTRSIVAANNTLISGFLGFIIAVGLLSLFSPDVWRAVMVGVRTLGHVVRAYLMLLGTTLLFMREDTVTVGEEVPQYDWGLLWDHEFFSEEMIDFLTAEGLYFANENVLPTVFFALAFISFALLAVVIFFALRSAIRALIRYFFHGREEDESESLIPDDASGMLRFMLSDLAAFMPRRRALPKDPVRRAYVKKINRHIKKGIAISKSDTPDTIANKIRPREDITELTAQYERVRYGQ